MIKSFDMELFMAGVLIEAHVKRQRHVRQAKIIQVAIAQRWRRENPWSWQKEHVVWFLGNRLSENIQATQCYYVLRADC